ncbi:MAG: DUF1559 domain-containing protein [Planctomycetes bacterium]|nr:DUF1559 domain-containing protein [Planctomycetota bacterium]
MTTRRAPGFRKWVAPRPGFTFLELLIVAAAIGILIAFLLPAVGACREAARRAACLRNLGQIMVAIQNYEFLQARFPSGTVHSQGPIAQLPVGYHHNWLSAILPYYDRQELQLDIDYSQGVYQPANDLARGVDLRSLICPSSGVPQMTIAAGVRVGVSTYAACHNDAEAPIDVDNNGVFFLNSQIRTADITDGLSNTIFIGERLEDALELGWMSGTRSTLRNVGTFLSGASAGARRSGPRLLWVIAADDDPFAALKEHELNEQDLAAQLQRLQPRGLLRQTGVDLHEVGQFAANHPGGSMFGFGDGSVRFARGSGNSEAMARLANRADGGMLHDE